MLDPVLAVFLFGIVPNFLRHVSYLLEGSLKPVITMALTVFQSLKSRSRAFRANLGGSKSCSGISGSLESFCVEVLRVAVVDFRALECLNCFCSKFCLPTVWARNNKIFSPRELATWTKSGASEISLTRTSYLVPWWPAIKKWKRNFN